MKKNLLTLAMVLTYFCSYAQNTPWSTSGNIGINTTSPESGIKLDVNGIGATGTQGSSRIYLGTIDATHALIQARDNSINQNLTFYASAYNFTTGNVGIGIANPVNALDVAGTVSATQNSSTASSFAVKNAASRSSSLMLYNNYSSSSRNFYLGTFDSGSSTGNLFQIRTSSYSSTDPSTANPIFSMTESGNVGIGTTSPASALDVAGTVSATQNSATASSLAVKNTASRNSSLLLYNNASSSSRNFYIGTFDSGSSAGNIFQIRSSNYVSTDPSAAMPILTMTESGGLAIGTTDPQGYKLAVNGAAIATSMTVKLYASWPDYVFKTAYQLPSLADVKTYIEQNHHLPGMPSAADVEKNGINLGEMNKVLLQKVEELTLYLIEKDKQSIEQNEKLKDQHSKIAGLQKQLTEQQKVNQSLQEQINDLARQIRH